jgi:hypothetical protein
MTWRNPDTDRAETVVVVAGGHNQSEALTSSELLFVDHATPTWKKGPALPRPAEYATILEFDNSLILTDGKFVYQLADPVIKFISLSCLPFLSSLQ